MGDLFAFITNYIKGTLCTWTLDGGGTDVCGLGIGGLPLAIGLGLVALFFGPLKDTATKFVDNRPFAIGVIVALVIEIFIFRDLAATLVAVVLLTAFLILSPPLSRFRIALFGRSAKLNDAVLAVPPVVFLAAVGVAWAVEQHRPSQANAAIVLLPSPRGDMASSDLQKYLRQVRVNLTEQLASFDILPSLDRIDKFPEYIDALGHPWNELPQKLDRFGLAPRQSVELLSSTWETFNYRDNTAIRLVVERRSYNPQTRTYAKGDSSRPLSLQGPKDPNAMVFSLLVSFEVVSRHLSDSKTDEATAATTFSSWLREFGGHLRERLEAPDQVILDDDCKTLKCLEPVVRGYKRLLESDFRNMRDKAAPEAERNLKTGIAAGETLIRRSQ
jgi:hypothetical protein